MTDRAHAKCSCLHCQVHLEFPLTARGTEIDCPQCGQRTILTVPEPVGELPPVPSVLTVPELLGAFTGDTPRPPASLPYLVGVLLVAGAMVMMPVLYIALIALAGWLTYRWAVHAKQILPNSYLGFFTYLAVLTLYVAPLFAGAVLVFFMIKPLFARRPPHAQPLALNPGAEPLLFSFVSQICQSVGAPFPARIDVDCQLYAGAGFRRGLGSFFGHDLVLTLGLPLVAGLTVEQLAAVIAHELGHFSQGFGMRLSYLIHQINAWFVRVVCHRDTWDLVLDEWAETQSLFVGVIVGCTRLAVWTSRQVLALLMVLSQGISCYLTRQREFHADACAIQLAGSQIFESQTFRFHLLNCALQNAYVQMQTLWNRHRALPANFPAYLQVCEQAMPAEVRKQIADTLGLASTGLFDTHPSPGDRIRCARQAQAHGVFHLDKPATLLFSNFEIISQQVSRLHYADDLGVPMALARFYAVGERPTVPDKPEPAPEETPSTSSGPRKLRILRNPQAGSGPVGAS